jgi:hypothetical protein
MMIFRRTWEAKATKRVVNKPQAATRKTINQLVNDLANRNVPGMMTTKKAADTETKAASVVN